VFLCARNSQQNTPSSYAGKTKTTAYFRAQAAYANETFHTFPQKAKGH